MSNKIKRILALVMVCAMMFSSSLLTYAAEENRAKEHSTDIITPRTSTVLGAYEARTITVENIAFPRDVTFTIVTASNASSNNTISWNLKQNGVKVDSGNTSVNGMYERDFSMAYGKYTFEVTNNANQSTTVFAYFK